MDERTQLKQRRTSAKVADAVGLIAGTAVVTTVMMETEAVLSILAGVGYGVSVAILVSFGIRRACR